MFDLTLLLSQPARKHLVLYLSFGVLVFSIQVGFLVVLSVMRYVETEVEYSQLEMYWRIYKDLATVIPAVTAVSIAASVLAHMSAIFLWTGPTVKETPAYFRKYPIVVLWYATLPVSLVVFFFSFLHALIILVGGTLALMCHFWVAWVIAQVRSGD